VTPEAVAGDVGGDVVPATAPLSRAIETLREPLEVANGALLAERRRVDELLVALADARTAAMITGCEAAVLRTKLALLTDRRPWWRRWFR
jgi:hypothetical protein